ncbi:MAG: CvpA family protein [Gammaproteobacteria bacterium]|nr:CvpA family protein [Gammaproteobacteria bacterium]
MIWADYVILAIVVFSALVGMIRGFTREIFSLASWIGAFVVAVLLVDPASRLIAPWIPGEQLTLILAFVGLFALTLLAGMVISHFASMLVERAKLGRVDRALGLFFGIVRGYVAVAALVVVASFTQIPQSDWWKQSLLIPWTMPAATWIARHLPQSRLDKVEAQKAELDKLQDLTGG